MRGSETIEILEVNVGRSWPRRGLWQTAAGQNTTADLEIGVSLGNVEMGCGDWGRPELSKLILDGVGRAEVCGRPPQGKIQLWI